MTGRDGGPVIVGGGLAGLSAARHLADHGVPFTLFEAGSETGGRVGTDELEGFRLDRGFQVLLTAYEEAKRVLDFDRLDLGEFVPGSLVWTGTRLVPVVDPLRRPGQAAGSLFGGIMRLSDAPRLAAIRRRSLAPPREAEAETTLAYLRRRGLSERLIERFMRPFLGGVFLERELNTPRWMFDFVFGKFALGSAALPARGMSAIPRQIEASLQHGEVRLGDPVLAIRNAEVELESGETRAAPHVIVATDQDTAARLLPGVPRPAGWSACTTLYFSTEQPPIEEPILVLNGDGPAAGPVNTVCVPSNVTPAYAPPGAALLSVTAIGVPERSEADLVEDVRAQLRGWFGASVREWRFLRTYCIRHGLPRFDGRRLSRAGIIEVSEEVTACGDWLSNPSIDGAMASGRAAAERALASLGIATAP